MKASNVVQTFPLSRIATSDVGVIGRKKHHIMGLLEVDVTAARAQLREKRKKGSAVSFTTWFLKTVADSIKETPQVHGVLKGRRRRVIFEEVDVTLMIERLVDGEPVPLPVVIRACETKSMVDIESQIAAAAGQSVDGTRDYELGRQRSPFLMGLYYRLPQFLRVGVMKKILANPQVRKATMGTVIVTSVAAGVRFPGWIVPTSMHNLAFGLGSVVREPRVVRQAVVPRDVLHLTVLLDHDVIDGAPATRFVSRLVKALERPDGMEGQ
jgi:pyruvate/2-oxoglutarate dehydrogenase complex dihydrolipoamide acyltransferase (E2) component